MSDEFDYLLKKRTALGMSISNKMKAGGYICFVYGAERSFQMTLNFVPCVE